MNHQWHTKNQDEVEQLLDTQARSGLALSGLVKRREQYGANELRQTGKKTILSMLIEQFKDFMVIILLVAALISGFLGEWSDSIVILIVVVLNAVLGVAQEHKAEESLNALKKMSAPHAKVIREGKPVVISAVELLPGDVIILETGDLVPADIRLIESSNLKIQEAALTGESVPVDKKTDTLSQAEIPLGDRVNMAYMGSLVTYGRGRGIVVETGMNSEMGKIAEMIQSEEGQKTPLQRKLEELGKWLGLGALGICALVFLTGVLYGKPVFDMFFIAVSLAVAAIPEGLPAIVTIVLAIGVQRMIKRNAIIRRLPAVETLGSATVICSDKTGTLTQNKMTVQKVYYSHQFHDMEELVTARSNEQGLTLLFKSGTLCNDGQISQEEGEIHVIGDPTETALVDAALKLELDKRVLEQEHPRVDEIPFDSDRKLMTTVNGQKDELLVYTKGAPDELLKRCDTLLLNGEKVTLTEEHKSSILGANEEMARQALRVLAMAYKEKDKANELESHLTYLGMVGMIDPARPEVKEAVRQCKQAGIKPIMITGDHKITAMAIATELGILEEGNLALTGSELEAMDDIQLKEQVRNISVYARVSPEHKVRIVKAWQEWGDIVAMTGDGVNDAPALKRANIGAAMGIVGTDVAKEASAMVLTDDNFATIVSAVEEGRVIYSNIQKAVQFLISCNIGEILVLFIATLLNFKYSPLLPIHILWVNLVTDTLPALALGLEPAEPNIMNRKPRNPKARVFDAGMIKRIGYQGTVIAAVTLAAFLIGLESTGDEVVARTMAFMVLALSQLTHAFNLRSNEFSLLKMGLFSNLYLVGAWMASAVLQLAVVFIPYISRVFKVDALPSSQWLEVIGLSLVPLLIVELFKVAGWNTGKEE